MSLVDWCRFSPLMSSISTVSPRCNTSAPIHCTNTQVSIQNLSNVSSMYDTFLPIFKRWTKHYSPTSDCCWWSTRSFLLCTVQVLKNIGYVFYCIKVLLVLFFQFFEAFTCRFCHCTIFIIYVAGQIMYWLGSPILLLATMNRFGFSEEILHLTFKTSRFHGILTGSLLILPQVSLV